MFPTYPSVSFAAHNGCMNCSKPMDPQTFNDAGYPSGRGRYRLHCADCGMTTFFDLHPEPTGD